MNLSLQKITAPLLTEKISQYLLKAAYYFIALVLISSGVIKIIDAGSLITVLTSAFPFVNENIQIAIASLLPLIEMLTGILLLLKIKKKEAMLAAVILFSAFTLFAVYGFIFGIEEDCGCFGNVVESSFGWGMIVRNLIFALIAFLILIQAKREIV